jgi:hypothetical protein
MSLSLDELEAELEVERNKCKELEAAKAVWLSSNQVSKSDAEAKWLIFNRKRNRSSMPSVPSSRIYMRP